MGGGGGRPAADKGREWYGGLRDHLNREALGGGAQALPGWIPWLSSELAGRPWWSMLPRA